MNKPYHTYAGHGTSSPGPGYFAEPHMIRPSSSMDLFSALDGVEMKISEALLTPKVMAPVSMPSTMQADMSRYHYDFSFEYSVLESPSNGL